MSRHLIPELHGISQTTIDDYTKHSAAITAYLNDFLLKYLFSLYREFDGDIAKAMILGEVAHHNIRLTSDRLPVSQRDVELLRAALKEDKLPPCNPFSVSEATGIPRETVRRKFAELVRDGYLKKTAGRSYIFTEKLVQKFAPTNMRLFYEFQVLCARLSQVLAQPDASQDGVSAAERQDQTLDQESK